MSAFFQAAPMKRDSSGSQDLMFAHPKNEGSRFLRRRNLDTSFGLRSR